MRVTPEHYVSALASGVVPGTAGILRLPVTMPRDVSLYDFIDRTHGHQAALDGRGLRGTCRREGVTGDMSGPKRVHPELCAVTVAKRFERRLVRIEEITAIGRATPGIGR